MLYTYITPQLELSFIDLERTVPVPVHYLLWRIRILKYGMMWIYFMFAKNIKYGFNSENIEYNRI